MKKDDISFDEFVKIKNNVLYNEDCLKSFVGEAYDNFLNKKFNIGAFLLTFVYMIYRKTYLYAFLTLLLFLLCGLVFQKFEIYIIFSIVIGFVYNPIYLSFAKNKVEKIKNKNKDKDDNELNDICSKAGGVSVVSVILSGCLTWIILNIVVLVFIFIGLLPHYKDLFDLIKKDMAENNISGEVIENANISGTICELTGCKVEVEGNNEVKEYTLKTNNNQLVLAASMYVNYVRLDLYYSDDTITGYKLYNLLTDEEMLDVKDEKDLRDRLNLLQEGTYTKDLKLEFFRQTTVFDRDAGYILCYEVDFVDNDRKYTMYYLGDDYSILEKNKTYNIKFELKINDNKEDVYKIISIDKID